jgi:L-threonate 2-dehydrogenase
MTDRVAVIGLGSMGLGMAGSLLRAGRKVQGADVSEAARRAFAEAGGAVSADAAEAARGCGVVVLVLLSAEQCEAVLLGERGIAATLDPGTVVIGCSTVAPSFARLTEARLEAQGLLYVDSPISGGAAKAAKGELTIIASGRPAAMAKADPILEAMAERVWRVGAEAGPASAVKMINQHLAGIHIAAACEAIALGIRAGLDPHMLYDIISSAAGSSWMFQNRVAQILEGDYRPHSAADIFVKDLGIVGDAARELGFPVPMASAALQMFLMAKAAGMGRDNDTSVVRVYSRIAGIELPGGVR